MANPKSGGSKSGLPTRAQEITPSGEPKRALGSPPDLVVADFHAAEAKVAEGSAEGMVSSGRSYEDIHAAMVNPDNAYEINRSNEVRIAAAFAYLRDNAGPVLESLRNEALFGKRKVEATKLYLEVLGVIRRTGRGSIPLPQVPEMSFEARPDIEELERILSEAQEAETLPSGNESEETGGD